MRGRSASFMVSRQQFPNNVYNEAGHRVLWCSCLVLLDSAHWLTFEEAIHCPRDIDGILKHVKPANYWFRLRSIAFPNAACCWLAKGTVLTKLHGRGFLGFLVSPATLTASVIGRSTVRFKTRFWMNLGLPVEKNAG